MVVEGKFSPSLLNAAQRAVKLGATSAGEESSEVSVWLRKPPRVDGLAARVHALIDVEKKSFQHVLHVLQADGETITLTDVYRIYARYYEMIGQPPPSRSPKDKFPPPPNDSAA